MICWKISAILNTVTAPLWDSPFVTEPYQRTNYDERDVEETKEFECIKLILNLKKNFNLSKINKFLIVVVAHDMRSSISLQQMTIIWKISYIPSNNIMQY